MQARKPGRAFGPAVAERAVRNRFPGHMVSTLDAEAVLLAGSARSGPRPSPGARPRPDFFIEARRPGEPSRVFVVTVDGNHQKATRRTAKADRSAFKQLARGSERAEHPHLAEWNTTPCLLMSTELLALESANRWPYGAVTSTGHGWTPDMYGSSSTTRRSKPGRFR
jgi:hypothetical protein